MEKVTGIGGFFYRANDPDKIAKWYANNLGVDAPPRSYDVTPWRQEAGTTIVGPFAKDTEYFGPDMTQHWMINFRVRDLDAMVAQLRNNGNEVEVEEETYPMDVLRGSMTRRAIRSSSGSRAASTRIRRRA